LKGSKNTKSADLDENSVGIHRPVGQPRGSGPRQQERSLSAALVPSKCSIGRPPKSLPFRISVRQVERGVLVVPGETSCRATRGLSPTPTPHWQSCRPTLFPQQTQLPTPPALSTNNIRMQHVISEEDQQQSLAFDEVGNDSEAVAVGDGIGDDEDRFKDELDEGFVVLTPKNSPVTEWLMDGFRDVVAVCEPKFEQ